MLLASLAPAFWLGIVGPCCLALTLVLSLRAATEQLSLPQLQLGLQPFNLTLQLRLSLQRIAVQGSPMTHVAACNIEGYGQLNALTTLAASLPNDRMGPGTRVRRALPA
jgi:hypothetical protein